MVSDWKGIIIENGLLDLRVIDYIGILGTRRKEIGISDVWIVHDVMVLDTNIEKVTSILSKGLRPGWYSYFIKGDRRIIVFKDKVFNIKRGSERSLLEVKNWAFKNYNILPESFSLEI